MCTAAVVYILVTRVRQHVAILAIVAAESTGLDFICRYCVVPTSKWCNASDMTEALGTQCTQVKILKGVFSTKYEARFIINFYFRFTDQAYDRVGATSIV